MRYGRWGAALPRHPWVAAAVLAVAVSSVAQTGPVPAQAKPEDGKPISKEQAKELFRSVDEILQFVSSDTKLPIRHSVKRRLISRDEVNKFLKEKFDEDEGAKRLQRSELVLKKFGLLDRDFELRPFLISLLTEQIAGFYDNKTKTVNLLDWISPEEQKPVLAHELTHALQDQSVDLERWSDAGAKGVSANAKEDTRHLETDELETARGAVAEGQAMVVYLDYSLRPSGRTLADAPELANRLKDTDAAEGGSPVLARAPLLLQQSLIFPYSEGLSFEGAVLAKGGKDAAFRDMLARPPSSSWEVMNPEVYLAHAAVPTLRLPDIHPMLDAEYAPYDIGVMGELDVRILAELFGGREMAEALAPAWNGGIYYAAQRRSATAAERASTASLAVFYLSRWKNADSARSFARTYAGQLPRKYANVQRVEEGAQDDEEVYRTNEGDAVVMRSGTDVFVSEGFALPLARRLRGTVMGAQTTGPVLSAAVGAREPSMAMAGAFQALGSGWFLSRDMLERAAASRGVPTETQREQQVW